MKRFAALVVLTLAACSSGQDGGQRLSTAAATGGDPLEGLVLPKAPTTTTTTAPPPPPPPPPARPVAQRVSRAATTARTAVTDGVWAALARCESGGNPTAHSSNGRYHGAFQFSLATWRSVGMSGDPHEHPFSVQLVAAKRLQARAGWGQWPSCARSLGLL